jgi:hypothetical protein
MKRRTLLGAIGTLPLAIAVPAVAAKALPEVHVFKSPYCGCCTAWIEHMRSAGFAVKASDVDDTAAARRRLGMPHQFGSCHTASVAGYLLEGHVPAEQVQRLLALKPKAIGLAVPAMPVGSPGMEVGGRKDPYDVFLVGPNGRGTVFAHYPA